MFIEEQLYNNDQIPVAKKYEMLGDRDATKLKLEMEGGEKREKKDVSVSETNISTEDKESEEKKEDVEVSATEDSVIENAAIDQSLKEDGSTNKDSLTVAYDPNVAIGKIIFNWLSLNIKK